MSLVKISPLPIVFLDTITDNALDCTFLLITCGRLMSAGPTASASNSQPRTSQFRLLLEQRSTGFSWCEGGGIGGGVNNNDEENRAPKDQDDASSNASSTGSTGQQQQPQPRSRLSGLRQMSAAGFANLRQRLSEGRKMLDRRVSTSSTSVEIGVEAVEASGGHVVKPESLASKIGDTRVSVQRTSGDLQILAGVFPDTAILTVHNCDLEVMPQSAYKLPRGTVDVLLLNKVMLVSTVQLGHGYIHVVSAHHAELHVDSGARSLESVFQSFSLSPDETVLALFKGHEAKAEDGDLVKDEFSSHSSNESTGVASPTSPSRFAPKPSQMTEFQRRVNAKVDHAKVQGRLLFTPCYVLTTKGLYMLEIERDPVSVFMELSMRSNSGEDGAMKKAEQLALTFGLVM